MTAKLNTTYKTRAYEDWDYTVSANDDAIITNAHMTKWGMYYDIHTAHNGDFNVTEEGLVKLLNI